MKNKPTNVTPSIPENTAVPKDWRISAPGPAGGAFRGAGERLSGSALSVSGSPAGSSFSGGVLTLGSERGPVLGSVAATVDNLESDGSVCYRGLLLGSGWQGETSSDGAQLGASGFLAREDAIICSNVFAEDERADEVSVLQLEKIRALVAAHS